MNWGKFFNKLAGVFRNTGTALNQVEDILPDALSIVEFVAAATPDRTDDQIAALAKDFTIGPVDLAGIGRPEDRLRTIARIALQRKVRLSIKESVINAALELALLQHKGS